MLAEDHRVGAALFPPQPQTVLEARHRFAAADVDILELRRRDFDNTVTLFEESRKIDALLTVALADTNEIVWNLPRPEQIVERLLQVCLLPQGKRARRRQNLARIERREMTLQPLEHVTFRRPI